MEPQQMGSITITCTECGEKLRIYRNKYNEYEHFISGYLVCGECNCILLPKKLSGKKVKDIK